MKSTLTIFVVFIISIYASFGQNFSGLQNKRLNKIEDVSSMLESGIGSLLGGKISGKIDSVVVLYDSEKTLRVKIWYTDYVNGFFTVSVIDGAKQKQSQVVPCA